MEKQTILIAQSSHLDLYWMAAQAECLEIGAGVVDDAINRALADEKFHFVVEAARFAEYYLHKHPGRLEDFKKVLASGQIEIAACYTDRCEHFHDGEALVRNVQIGKRRLRALLGYDSKFAFHPDLPGFTEQTPQINKKMNVPFYFASRGFKTGVRALWEGPDGSSVVFYDFPKHYSYYEFGLDIIPYIGEIRKDTGMRDFLLLCSAGDCGPVGTFLVMDERKKPYRVNLTEMLAEVEAKYGVNCVYSGAYGALCKLDNTDLPVLKGESPNHWGANGSTTNVLMFQFDKKVTAALCDSEKYNAIARLLGPGAEPDKNETDRIMETFTSGKKRRYSIDMIQEPASAQQWLDFAWRLMCVTHDHNYSGIEASQSEFDRFMYKKTALRLSEHIIKRGQDAVLGGVQSAAGELVVFNTLNWAREELVRIPRGVMDPGKSYCAADGEGNEAAVCEDGGEYLFMANAPSVGYKKYRIIGTDKAAPAPAASAAASGGKITLKNRWYDLTVNAKNGLLENITDRETGLSLSGEFLRVCAYVDDVTGVDEKNTDWKLIEDASANVWSVTVTSDNALATTVTVKTELLKAALEIEIKLWHREKKIGLKPTLRFQGVRNVKIYATLPFAPELNGIYYGVPYGAQKFGGLFEECGGRGLEMFAGDEVSEELYRRYREIHYWMALEDGKRGFALTTLHGAVDIRPDMLGAVLARTVRSGGDWEFYHLNQGELEWNFNFTSYAGNWEDNGIYRRAWEYLHPLSVRECAENPSGSLPESCSFLDTGGQGVMSVFKESDYTPGDYVMRVFNASSGPGELKIGGLLAEKCAWECVNLDETPCGDAAGRLGAYEIKTLKRKDGE